MKVYEITLPGEALDAAQFEAGLKLVADALPQPPTAPGRFGAGFVICHQGRGVDYLVLCWWARENELPIRVFVHDLRPGASWRAAQGDESICVWDLEVIALERDQWVRTVLSRPGAADVEPYLNDET